QDVARPAVFRDDGAAFGQRVLAIDLGPVLLDHVVDAIARSPLLAGLGEEDHVAIQRYVHALEQHQDHHAGDDVRFVIARASGIDGVVLPDGGEGIDGPLFTLHADDVRVAHQKDRTFGAAALYAGDEIGARGIEREGAGRDALTLENGLDAVHRLGL